MSREKKNEEQDDFVVPDDYYKKPNVASPTANYSATTTTTGSHIRYSAGVANADLMTGTGTRSALTEGGFDSGIQTQTFTTGGFTADGLPTTTTEIRTTSIDVGSDQRDTEEKLV